MGESIGPDVRRFKLVVDLARKALDLVYVTLMPDNSAAGAEADGSLRELRAEHSLYTAVDGSSSSHHSTAALQQQHQQQYSIASQLQQRSAAAAVPYGGSIDAEWSLSVMTPQPALAVPEPFPRRPDIGGTPSNNAFSAEQLSFHSGSLLTSAAWQQQQQQQQHQQQLIAVSAWQSSSAQHSTSVVLLSPETVVMPQGIAGCGTKRGQVS
jgi:hypothetical protein